MLVKRQQHVGIIAGSQHLAAADPDLENGGSAGNGGGNGHEGHDFLLAAPGQPGQETTDGLNAILGIAGNADHRVADPGDFFRATGRRRINHSITHGTLNIINPHAKEFGGEGHSPARNRCLNTINDYWSSVSNSNNMFILLRISMLRFAVNCQRQSKTRPLAPMMLGFA